MKMERRGSLGQEPLPGDRQGMSGADAGHDSMRTVGGRVLRRRAPVTQPATAPQQETQRGGSRTPPRAPPAEGAAQENQPVLTQAGRPRQRMKWTTSINETIMRIFYRVTNLGRETIGYRQQLHAEFCMNYPHLDVTEQRIADQYRIILRNNLIPETRLTAIKREVELDIANRHVPLEEQNPNVENEEQAQLQDRLEEQDPNNQDPNNEAFREQLNAGIKKALAEYDGTNPLTRPPLPKLNSSRKLAALIDILNFRILPELIPQATTLEQLHLLIYCAATSVTKVLGVGIAVNQRGISRTIRQPPSWERRLQKKIDDLRKDIGQVTEYIRGVNSGRLQRKVEKIISRTQCHSQQDPANQTAEQCSDTLKQKLSVYTNRLKRYKASNSRKQDNTCFQRSEKTFYRKLDSSASTSGNVYPSQDEVAQFWGTQLATSVACNVEAGWVEEERRNSEAYEQMPQQPFTTEEVSEVIRRLHNWKAAGPEHVHNYWIKKLWAIHQQLTALLNDALLNPEKVPLFLTQGVTYLLSKDHNNTHDPTKYRPITCLPTLYKLITSCITERIYGHCERNNIIAVQQKGCARGAMGCREQLIIDSVICNQAYNTKRNLYAAYVDYKKAFDSVPHVWLTNILKIYRVDAGIVSLLEHLMSSWRTKLKLQVLTGQNIETDVIPIRRGIFQGDSLSPLWFCLAMNPLSNRLNSTRYGFALKHHSNEVARLNHLLYMDDIKLLGATRNQLEQMLKIVEEFSADIGMQFGLDKCCTVNIIKGKMQAGDFELQNGQIIQAMEPEDSYKYLGIKQAQRIEHRVMKDEMTNEFIKRMRRVLKTNLNSKNLFKALNTYACTALTYSFGIIGWSRTDIENLQRKARTLLTKANKHHPRSAIERTTLPRHQGGRGLTDIATQLDKQLINLRSYFFRKAETSQFYRAICEADDCTPLKLREQEFQSRHSSQEEKLQRWLGKPLHGRHVNEVNQEYVDSNASNYWLTSGQLFPETEGFLVAIQDQVIPTRNYLKYIVNDPSVQTDTCRYGCQTSETIQHITGGCQIFAPIEYKERHDSVAKILHQELAEKLKLLPTEKAPYYRYSPEPVLENQDFKLYWDRTVLTDQRAAHNRPDVIIVDKNKRKTILIDVAIPNNNNIQAKYIEKIVKYRDLEVKIERQWGMESVKTLPIIISTTGVIPRSLLENIKKLDIKESIYRTMQRAVLLATSRTVRKFVGNTGHGNT